MVAGIAGATVALAAAPAVAASSITVRSGSTSVDGGTVRQNTTLQVVGSDTAPDRTGLTAARTLSLSVDPPGAGSYDLAPHKSVKSNADGTISGSLDTTCVPWAGSCVDAVNGGYAFSFSNGSVTRTSHVTLLIPPATPRGFAATSDDTVATFTWQPNDEPDLVGYDIVEGSGNDVTPGGIDDSVCDADSCTVSIDFGGSARGTTHSFRVLALRHTAPRSTSTVDSEPSAPQSVSFAAASSPSGAPEAGSGSGDGTGSGGGSGQSDGGGTGRTSSGGGHSGSGEGSPSTHRVSGRHPAADLRASLPTVTAGSAPDLPNVVTEIKPLPQGTFKPTLAYPDRVSRDPVTRPVAAAPDGVVHDIVRVLDTSALWRGVGAAAVLLLLVGHLHAWIQRVEVD